MRAAQGSIESVYYVLDSFSVICLIFLQFHTWRIQHSSHLFRPAAYFGLHGSAGLDFNREEAPACFEQRVNFVAVAVAPEIEFAILAAICKLFLDFRQHDVLKYRPGQPMMPQLSRGLYAQKMA